MDLQSIINKAHSEWKADPMKAQEEHEVISKYGKIFSPRNIDDLTLDDFRSFLKFKNNKHWTGLERAAAEIYRDMPKLKKTLKLLVDEQIPIDERIRRIRQKTGPDYHKGLGTLTTPPSYLLYIPKNIQS